jgi:hypothetical protein
VIRLRINPSPRVRTYVLPLVEGEKLPHVPSQGIDSEAGLAGCRSSLVTDGGVYPSDAASRVGYVRSATERNIYRKPIP